MTATPRTLIDGRNAAGVSVDDRGLNYGDGLFETVRVHAGATPLWTYHWSRLRAGCARLALPVPAEALVLDELHQVAQGMPEAVVKIVLTRGVGGRGYAPPRVPTMTRLVRAFALPEPYVRLPDGGVALRWCDTRLSEQPALAGIKHLNRLDQVLARAEWDDARIADGVMCDQHGRVVCATAGNVFVGMAGTLHTPELHGAGVAGVCRAAIIAERLAGSEVVVRDMLPAELERADEVFVCNSVRGVVAVAALGAHTWRSPGPCTQAVIAALRARGLPSEHTL